MKIAAHLAALSFLVTAGFSLQASAHSDREDVVGTAGYVVDQRGHVVRNQAGDCWRTIHWTEQLAVKACDPHLFPERAEAPPAPPAPTPPPAPRMVEQTRTLGAHTLFGFDSVSISDSGKRELDQLAQGVKQLDRVEGIRVIGHTDSTGPAEYNLGLSQRRAESVKAYLVSQGIDASLITAEGRGETEPVASNDTREGRAENRRVDIFIRGSETVTVPAR